MLLKDIVARVNAKNFGETQWTYDDIMPYFQEAIDSLNSELSAHRQIPSVPRIHQPVDDEPDNLFEHVAYTALSDMHIANYVVTYIVVAMDNAMLANTSRTQTYAAQLTAYKKQLKADLYRFMPLTTESNNYLDLQPNGYMKKQIPVVNAWYDTEIGGLLCGEEGYADTVPTLGVVCDNPYGTLLPYYPQQKLILGTHLYDYVFIPRPYFAQWYDRVIVKVKITGYAKQDARASVVAGYILDLGFYDSANALAIAAYEILNNGNGTAKNSSKEIISKVIGTVGTYEEVTETIEDRQVTRTVYSNLITHEFTSYGDRLIRIRPDNNTIRQEILTFTPTDNTYTVDVFDISAILENTISTLSTNITELSDNKADRNNVNQTIVADTVRARQLSDTDGRVKVLVDADGSLYVTNGANQEVYRAGINGTLSSISHGTYLGTNDVIDDLTHTNTNKPLSAKQGKEIKALIDGIKNGTNVNNFSETEQAITQAMQNVIEVAEGKTKNYVLSNAIPDPYVNSLFNTSSSLIMMSSSDGNGKFKDYSGNDINLTDLKIGDIISIIEPNVPDRWVMYTSSGSVQFGALEIKLDFDLTPTQNSSNPVTSGGIYNALQNKQNTLIPGDNITIENNVISAQGSGGSGGNYITVNSITDLTPTWIEDNISDIRDADGIKMTNNSLVYYKSSNANAVYTTLPAKLPLVFVSHASSTPATTLPAKLPLMFVAGITFVNVDTKGNVRSLIINPVTYEITSDYKSAAEDNTSLINTIIPAVEDSINDIKDGENINSFSEVETALEYKQDKLTAGNNITINNNVIRANIALYEHNIYVSMYYNSTERGYFSATISTTNNTPLTPTGFIDLLVSRGHTTSQTMFANIKGLNYRGQNYYNYDWIGVAAISGAGLLVYSTNGNTQQLPTFNYFTDLPQWTLTDTITKIL